MIKGSPGGIGGHPTTMVGDVTAREGTDILHTEVKKGLLFSDVPKQCWIGILEHSSCAWVLSIFAFVAKECLRFLFLGLGTLHGDGEIDGVERCRSRR